MHNDTFVVSCVDIGCQSFLGGKGANGSFLAIGHMRGRKPRHISSETEKFWLVGYIPNPNKYKGYNVVRFFLAGHWSLLPGHFEKICPILCI